MVQWLALCTFTAEDAGSIPGGELRFQGQKTKTKDSVTSLQLTGGPEAIKGLYFVIFLCELRGPFITQLLRRGGQNINLNLDVKLILSGSV